MQIPEQVQMEFLDKLEENGKEGYAVGGCVRDSVLGTCAERLGYYDNLQNRKR